MSNLRLAAMALIHRWDSESWQDELAPSIKELRDALEIPTLEEQMREFESGFVKVKSDSHGMPFHKHTDGSYTHFIIKESFVVWQIARGYK